MGYMGFGMMSWTYKQRARKPFSKHKSKPVCSTLPKHNREFKIQPSKQIRNHSSFIEILIVLVIMAAFYVIIPQIVEKGNNRRQQKQLISMYQDNAAFSFLINSGEQRLKRNQIIGAYSEFKLAYTIKPNDEKVNQLLLETLSVLCVDGNNYCIELDKVLNSSL